MKPWTPSSITCRNPGVSSGDDGASGRHRLEQENDSEGPPTAGQEQHVGGRVVVDAVGARNEADEERIGTGDHREPSPHRRRAGDRHRPGRGGRLVPPRLTPTHALDDPVDAIAWVETSDVHDVQAAVFQLWPTTAGAEQSHVHPVRDHGPRRTEISPHTRQRSLRHSRSRHRDDPRSAGAGAGAPRRQDCHPRRCGTSPR